MSKHVVEYLNSEMQEGEKIVYSFYVVKLASFSKFLIMQIGAVFESKHCIITITNQRVLINQMDPMGRMTGVSVEFDGDIVDEIKVKRGLLKTTVTFVLGEDEMTFKPNNICIGMPYHKDSLIKLAKEFG